MQPHTEDLDSGPHAESNPDAASGGTLQSCVGETFRELAHEFGNLLFPLQMILELQAHASPLSPDELNRLLRAHIDEMTTLTARFRIVGRYLSARLEPCWTELLCDDLVHSAQELCRFPREQGHTVRFDLTAAPSMLRGDREQLQQALAELIDNALRFTRAESTIIVTVQRQGSDVEFHVADSGPGIALAIQSRIFDPFIHGNAKLDFATGQLGCGLAIVRGIAQVHGGTAELRRSSAIGSEFVLRVPMQAIA